MREIAELKTRVGPLEERVSSLTTSLDAYKLPRNRFISSTFKRDKPRNATNADKRLIAEGNAWAHGGDAVVGAMLYQDQTTNRRRDPSAYERPYGIHLATVFMIGKLY